MLKALTKMELSNWKKNHLIINKIESEILPEVNVFVKAIETISPTDFISQHGYI